MKRIPFETMKEEIVRVLLKKGFTKERAEECALLFAEASLEGVYSHGLNRVPRFVDYIEKGLVDIHAVPTKIDSIGMLERYDGNFGAGNLNAKMCMQRAIEIAHENGVGIVTVRNTNHWMRGGSYGWQAANAGCIGICWTNTESCMPPWGAKETKIGNNPFVLAVPRESGNIVLDMAMSQFSYGKLEVTRLKNELLPIDGGFDSDGQLTRDPAEIEKSMRILPTGYWKGSGLSILLDLIAALLSGGLSTRKMDELKPQPGISGYGGSQVFIAMDPSVISGELFSANTVNEAVEYLHQADPSEIDGKVTFPGERTVETRQANLEKGIPVDEKIWQTLLDL
jgi:3-dehydro-L-gulonate 2-dehydrogenase